MNTHYSVWVLASYETIRGNQISAMYATSDSTIHDNVYILNLSPVDCSAGNKRTPPVTAGITELDVPSKKSCYQMLNPMDQEIQNKQLGKRTAGRAC